MNASSTIRTYYHLTKPGIIYGNALVAAGGFLLASKGSVDLRLLLATLAGMSLVIASACVVNNYIDRSIDEKMARTRRRALVRGTVGTRAALVFAAVLGLTGGIILAVFTNPLTLAAGIIGYVVYVVLYGIAKRRSVHGTLVGSISGAIPPLAGYTAVSGSLDTGAVLLFLILAAWQMPHFYSIAVYRSADYAAAGLPVLPVVRDIYSVQRQIIAYVILFLILCGLMTFTGTTGYSFFVVLLALGAVWLRISLTPLEDKRSANGWARRMFSFSLVVLLGFSLMLSLDHLLP